jgi:uncharacterized lipoprotein YmbA
MSGYVKEHRGMRVKGECVAMEKDATKAQVGLLDRKAMGRVPTRRASAATAALALAAAAVLSGCASSPDSHYYTLSEGSGKGARNNVVAQATASELGTGSIAPGMNNGSAGSSTQGVRPGQPLLIEVMPVNVPSQVSRPQIVTTTRDGKVDVHDYSRWASPLDDEIGNALSEGLTHRLGAIDTYRTPRPLGSTAYQITVNVQRFVSIPDDSASIDAVWSIVRSSDQLTLTCRSSASEPIGHGFENLAAGQRTALGRIADQIAQGVRIEVPVPVLKAPDTSVAAAAPDALSPTGKGKTGHSVPPPMPAPKATLPVLSCPY